MSFLVKLKEHGETGEDAMSCLLFAWNCCRNSGTRRENPAKNRYRGDHYTGSFNGGSVAAKKKYWLIVF